MLWSKAFCLCAVLILSLWFCVEAVPIAVDKTKVETPEQKLEAPQSVDTGLHYDRYLREVIDFLEKDQHFREKLHNTDMEDIKQGKLAKELDFVGHHVRTKLDELKRQEVNRLRTLIKTKQDVEGGHEMNHKALLKQFEYMNHMNPHTFEVEDLDKLIKSATSDLENYDKERHEEFKRYEMMKDHKRKEHLKNLDEEHRKDEEQHYEELRKKHADHPKINHPGSEDQLKEVWKESDGLDPNDFDPKTFFKLHDTNGDGYIDEQELEALFTKELEKMYSPNLEEDDMTEMEEERLRMREHVMNEVDTNKDRLVSLDEFLISTNKKEFQEPDSWETLEQAPAYTDEEMKLFEEQLAQEESNLNQKNVDLQKQKEELERQQEQLNAQKAELQQAVEHMQIIKSEKANVAVGVKDGGATVAVPLVVKRCQYYQETANLYPLVTSKTYLHTLSRPGSFFFQMAQQGVLLDQDQFCCSVCLDLLKEPVTTACGHSYCRSCIEGCWDKNVLKGVYSCPQCRQTFTPRPTLRKNNMLAEVVEKLKKTGLQAATPPTLCYAGPRDVACDFCTGTRKQKALMSCLACLASYCETHLQPHYEVPAFKKHKLIKATAQLQEKICSHHDKLLEVYCRTDQQCICMLCVMDVHKGHDTVSATAERTEKQKQLGMSQQKVQQRVQKREKELKELKQAVESLKHSAQAAVEDSEKIFTQLIRSIERRCSEVKELIRAQEKAQVSQAEVLLEQLKQEIAELRKTNTELEQLSHTEDHIHFLQNYQSLSSPSVSSDLPSITVRPLQYFGYVNKTVSELREKLEYFLKGEWTKISTTVNVADILPTEPKTREQFLQYSCQLTLNPNTACEELFLTEGKRKVIFTDQAQPYPNHPDRFTNYYQVLCREGLSGCCYWEVEWSGHCVHTAVSYKDISRTRAGHAFGSNDKSWSLGCSSGGYRFIHNNVVTNVSGPWSSRVGVYLDHKAGTLSFYSVSDTMTLLHRVQTTFPQPLYPGFRLYGANDTAELCKLW